MSSTAAVPGLRTPGVGFEQPFDMLHACHERVQRTLGLLVRLRQHLVDHGADAAARDAARDVLRYFDLAAPLHHEDEERHVFPRLRATEDPVLVALVQRLQHDHRCMEAEWAEARRPLQAVAQGVATGLDASAIAALDRFAARYDAHLAAEDATAYPAARALMVDPADRLAMGREMAARRGTSLVHRTP